MGVRKGPWLMAPRPGAITVMIEREVPGPVTVQAWRLMPVGAAQSPPIVAVDSVNEAIHEVHLHGLAAGGRYRYEVTGPGLEPVGGTFNAAPDDATPFRFILYGDTRTRVGTHEAIVHALRREGADFVVHTGDLVANGRNERLWQEFFDIERDLLRDAIFIPVIGNHELQNANPRAIENFRRYVHCPPTSPRPELDYSLVYGNVRLILANAYDDWRRPAMRQWMEDQLATARREGPNDFILVVTHWGMHSSGPHGENRNFRAAGFDALFRRYDVDLIVAGHDHIYERGNDRGQSYLVTGGAGAPLYRSEHRRPYTVFFTAQHHYVRVDAERDRLELTALRVDGTVFDHFTLRKGAVSPPERYGPPEPPPVPGRYGPPSRLSVQHAEPQSPPSTAAVDQRVGIGAASVVGDTTDTPFEVRSRDDRRHDPASSLGSRRVRSNTQPYGCLCRFPGSSSGRRGHDGQGTESATVALALGFAGLVRRRRR